MKKVIKKKKEEEIKVEKLDVTTIVTPVPPEVKEVEAAVIKPITDTLGNGDLNTLKDKINEIIVHINS